MAELKFKPIPHSHKEFLAKAATRKGFVKAYDALSPEYQAANQMLRHGPAPVVAWSSK